MAHDANLLSKLVFQRTDGSTGTLELHDDDSMHEGDGIIKTSLLANGAVTTIKLDDEAVTEEKVADGAITKEKLSEEMQKDWDSISHELQRFRVQDAINVSGIEYDPSNGTIAIHIGLGKESRWLVFFANGTWTYKISS